MNFPRPASGLLFGLALLATTSLSQAATVNGDIPTGWIALGTAGTGTADGSVVAAPTVNGGYTYVSTVNGLTGVGALENVGGTGSPTNGSTLTTSVFTAAAGDVLQFFFNYVTSDGSGFADYAWARVLDTMDAQVALLFTARTTPGGSSVPGFAMPTPEATLNPVDVLITANATSWSALDGDSGSCYSTGCGLTGWVESNYTLATAGDYKLQFGVTNWNDTIFDSGLAIAGANIGGVAIDPTDPPSAVPLPAAGWLLMAGLGGLSVVRRRRKTA